jgi:hypothetical protein
MGDEPDKPGPDLVPVLTLAGLLLLVLLGWWLFPRLQRAIAFQDCVAVGRTDCLPH